MTIVQIVIVLVIMGLLLFLVHRVFPLRPWMVTTIDVLAALWFFIWLMHGLGFISGRYLPPLW